MGTVFKNLVLHDYQEKSFYHALRTKGFVILAGLSGTGKTKIFEEFCVNFDIFYKIGKYCGITMLKNNSIKYLIDCLEEIINENLNKWKHFSGILDTQNYRINVESLDNNIIKLLNEINITKTELCLHYLISEKKYKKRNSIGGLDDFIEVYEAEEKLVNDIIPVLKKIKNLEIINDEDLQKAFSPKVKEFIWFLYHPKDYPNYLAIIGEVFEYLENEIFSKEQEIFKLRKLFLSIRPDFKDSKSLLGFFNPIKGEYQKPELLDFILKAQKEYIQYGKFASPYFVLFDEMNLARVEYYFADFLSVLESKRVESKSDVDNEMIKNIKDENNNGVSEDKLIGFYSKPIILHTENLPDIPQKLYLPPNLYFIGSVNVDETTYMFSPKVLDRAFTIEFDADIEMYIQRISEQNTNETCGIENQDEMNSQTEEGTDEHSEYLESQHEDLQMATQVGHNAYSREVAITTNQQDAQGFELADFLRGGKFTIIQKDCVSKIAKTVNQQLEKSYQDILKEIFSILKPYGLHFGYRVFDEVMMFMFNATTDTQYNMDPTEALDLAIKMKILPKFHGTRQKLESPIKKFINYCKKLEISKDNDKYDDKYLNPQSIPVVTKDRKVKFDDDTEFEFFFPHTARKLIEMLYKLQTQGFASFF